jgi:hypothetical protein
MNIQENKHDYILNRDAEIMFCKTTSIGIFKWVVNKHGDGLKRSKTIVRVKGPVKEIDKIESKVKGIIKELDEGTYTGARNVSVIIE